VTGASDDDPAGIGTYVQAGAQFGFSQLWTALFTFPVMTIVQEMCGRIGTVTGLGLTAVIRKHYAGPILYFIVCVQVLTNTVNIGADLSAMAASANLLIHIPYLVLLGIVACLTVVLIVVLPYRTYATYLKFLGLTLLTYVAAAFMVRPSWSHVAAAMFVPHISLRKDFLLTLIAVFGVTISPYEFFWQSNEEVEELVEEKKLAGEEAGNPRIGTADVKAVRADTAFGMFFSNAIMFFIVVVSASTLNAHGHTNVQTAEQAAQVLRPIAGTLAFVLFAAGIVSAGLLSIPVMAASSAYVVSAAFGWKRSLRRPFWEERRFYGIIAGSCLLGLAVNIAHVTPFRLLYYSAVLNGLISPPLLFIVTQIAGNRRIMGRFANRPLSNIAGWVLCGFMTVLICAFFALSA
jgi:NRAMP (natural resistance-associated macrophage protein)-like metal ion transporter